MTANNDFGTQDCLTAQLWEMMDTQQDIIDSQGNTVTSQRDMIQGQQATISILKAKVSKLEQQIDGQEANALREAERTKYHLDALREMATIRDVQEDKLDAMAEEVERLSTELEATNTLVQKQSTHRVTDQQLYRTLLGYGDIEEAGRVLASARRVEQRSAVCRAWLYENDKAGEESSLGNGKKPSWSMDVNRVTDW